MDNVHFAAISACIGVVSSSTCIGVETSPLLLVIAQVNAKLVNGANVQIDATGDSSSVTVGGLYSSAARITSEGRVNVSNCHGRILVSTIGALGVVTLASVNGVAEVSTGTIHAGWDRIPYRLHLIVFSAKLVAMIPKSDAQSWNLPPCSVHNVFYIRYAYRECLLYACAKWYKIW